MRKAGISMKRTSDIPFGIRAIQHGIEVDGIWISRPPTPNTDSPRKLASSSTLIAADSAEAIRKGKKLSADSSALSTSPDTRRGRGPSVSDGDHRTNDSHSQQSDQSARSPRVSQFGAPRPTRPQGVNDLSEDTLRRFEGQGLGSKITSEAESTKFSIVLRRVHGLTGQIRTDRTKQQWEKLYFVAQLKAAYI
ncbi:hypothetical protein VTK73DRAFT_7261 [Phialemonium thermophilum]|uniref:Uncharacterized protein n=1 Tax=Phialemonium thermophilum TaxID=223376 RepID=A0ABR3XU58_9PEZI